MLLQGRRQTKLVEYSTTIQAPSKQIKKHDKVIGKRAGSKRERLPVKHRKEEEDVSSGEQPSNDEDYMLPLAKKRRMPPGKKTIPKPTKGRTAKKTRKTHQKVP